MKSPALIRTPEGQGHAIAQAGSSLAREATQRIDQAAQRLDPAAQEAERERSRLSFGPNTRVAALVMHDDRWSRAPDAPTICFRGRKRQKRTPDWLQQADVSVARPQA